MNTTTNPSSQPEAPAQTTVQYYPINEDAARRAKETMSFSGYTPGSATAEYSCMVNHAAELAQQQKRRVYPEYHAKIDHFL